MELDNSIPRIIIECKGGVVQAMHSNIPTEIVLVDWDEIPAKRAVATESLLRATYEELGMIEVMPKSLVSELALDSAECADEEAETD